MRTIIMTLFCISISVLHYGCKEDESDKSYTITGKVVKSCDNPMPFANLPFELWYYSDSKRDSKQHATGVTDENGEFKISYTHTPNGFNSSLNIITANGPFGQKNLLYNIPQNQNIHADNVYTDSNYYLIAKINTEKSYTALDTLFYNIGLPLGQYKYVVGPFSNNQIVDTVSLFLFDGWSDISGSRFKRNYEIRWLIGIKYNDPKKQNRPTTSIDLCKKYSEVVLDLTKAIE
jgi:hypothetical protein